MKDDITPIEEIAQGDEVTQQIFTEAAANAAGQVGNLGIEDKPLCPLKMSRRTRLERADNPFAVAGMFTHGSRDRNTLRMMDMRTRRVAHQYYPHDLAGVIAAQIIRKTSGYDIFYYSEGRDNIVHNTLDILIDGKMIAKVENEWISAGSELKDLGELNKRADLLVRAVKLGLVALPGTDPLVLREDGRLEEVSITKFGDWEAS